MKVAILGLGRFGTRLVEELVSIGAEVLAVDRLDARVNEVAETATLATVGNIADFDFLSTLALESYDSVVVAVGSDMAVSVLVTLTLKKRMRIRYVVAKASIADHAEALTLAGADNVVSPEQEAAVRLAHTIGPSSHLGEYLSLGPTVGCARLEAPASAHGRPLAALEPLARRQVVLLALIRGNAVTYNPGPDAVVQPGDTWLIAGDDEHLRRIGS